MSSASARRRGSATDNPTTYLRPEPASASEDGEEDNTFNDDHFSVNRGLNLGSAISFKKRKARLSPRYSIFGSSSRNAGSVPLQDSPRSSPFSGSRTSFESPPEQTNDDQWVDEGPGRRVYDDLTAIDWIYEYTRERLRVRSLHEQRGLIASLKQLWDSSEVWVVLIGTGVMVGLLAALMDIVLHWLGDLKEGHCSTSFYLSRSFCCWGLSENESCADWEQWSGFLHAERTKGGAYVVNYLVYILLSLAMAATAAVLVRTYAPYARHSGIPEIKTVLGGFVIRRFMGGWTLLIKCIGLCLSVSSGLWLGKEGPLVHVAACCANILMKPFTNIRRNEARKREVLSAAASAGISVAFGSPIGGVLFSLEQLSYYFPDKTMWQSFVCAMLATITLQFLNPYRTGKLVLYQVTYTRSWHSFEMVPFCIIGILGGLYGAFFIKLNMRIATWRKTSAFRHFPIVEVLIVSLVTALLSYPVTFMRVQISELVANLFQECHPDGADVLGLCKAKAGGPISLLLFSSGVGIAMTSVTFGLQVPAGVILPSMAIGSLYGRAVGIIVQTWQKEHSKAWMFTSCDPDSVCITPGVYAIIGAASALGGVTRMTVSIVVIMFELTGALTYVLPIMIAVMLSKWVGDAFGKKGIYETWINFKEYPFLENKDEPVPDIPVSQIMTRIEDMVVITATGNSITSLDHLLETQPFKGFPVVTDTREALLLGYISRSELRYALDQATHVHHFSERTECFFTASTYPHTEQTLDLRDWMDQTPITLPSRSSLLLAANLFRKLGLRYILIATHGQLQGLLTKTDVVVALNHAAEDDEMIEAREEGGAMSRRLLDLDGDSSDITDAADERDELGERLGEY